MPRIWISGSLLFVAYTLRKGEKGIDDDDDYNNDCQSSGNHVPIIKFVEDTTLQGLILNYYIDNRLTRLCHPAMTILYV